MSDKKIKINVSAMTRYLSEESSPKDHRFLWVYEISIENQTSEIVQLLNRYWRITDMRGHVEEVRGPGVVGLQPIIKPTKRFVYSSFCQLTTPQGTMEGYYELQTLEEIRYLVEIPKFVLSCPDSMTTSFRSRLH